MLRVTSAGVLVVPPFECAWLSLEDSLGPERAANGALVAFQCRADNDVTLLLKRVGGGKRWQARTAPPATAAAADNQNNPNAPTASAAVEPNYTVILGSHRNTCLKFEKNGETVCSVRGVPGATLTAAAAAAAAAVAAAAVAAPDGEEEEEGGGGADAETAPPQAAQFQRMWVNYDARAAAITVGAGDPGCGPCFTWTDGGGGNGGGGGGGGDRAAAAATAAATTSPPIEGIRHVGLSCWDKHVGYRDVRVLPAIPAERLAAAAAAPAPGTGAAATGPATPPPRRPPPFQEEEQEGLLQQQQQNWEGARVLDPLQHAAAGAATAAATATAAAPTTTAPAAPLAAVLATTTAATAAAATAAAPPQATPAPTIPSLFRFASLSLAHHGLSPLTCCQALSVAELLLPAAGPLYRAAVEACAAALPRVARLAPHELAGLGEDALADVLLEPLLACPERCVLAAVCVWLGVPAPAGFEREGEEEREEEEDDAAAAAPPPQPMPPLRAADEAARAVALVRFPLMSAREIEAARSSALFAAYPSARAVMEAALSAHEEGQRGGGGARGGSGARAAAAAAAAAGQAAVPCAPLLSSSSSSPPDLLAVLHDRRRVRLALLAAPDSPDRQQQQQKQNQHHQQQQQKQNQHHQQQQQGEPAPQPPPPAAARRSQRLGPATRELMYVCDGDRNGVFAFLGTDYGRRTNTWVNPALSGAVGGGGAGGGGGGGGGGPGGPAANSAVRVWASSPPGRHTNPPAILGGAFLRTSYAGPRHAPAAAAAVVVGSNGNGNNGNNGNNGTPSTATPPAPESWWAVDLGARHRLLVNYYTLRHDGSSDGFARGWLLQGSNDLRSWATLRAHRDDPTLRLPGQRASWPVVGAAAARPFRAFRLVLTQPAAGGSWHFVLSQLELYGLLTVYPAAAVAAAGAAAGAGVG